MADRCPAIGSDDPRVNAALADYLQRIDRGESVPVDDFLAQHAEIAGELRSLLVTSEDLARLAPGRLPANLPTPEVSTRSVAEQNVETVAPQRVQKSASAETMLQRLPDAFGRYRIIRPLGSGAMGDVYLADDSQLHRQVAIKTPSFDADETGELLERFYREARSAAVLRHSNICPVFDVGEINGRHYISMAYIEGQPLSAYVRSDKPQPERQALAVIRKLALALQEAHDHGIIHRDLKPGNVMIDRKGEPIVMDFGLARAVQPEAGARLTQSGMLVGSPAYMSPEQVEGDTSRLSPATDQYSLGVILYELLTGGLPFRGGVTAVIAAILTKSPTPPGELRADLDPRIGALCLKMMSKSPRDRFPSMREVAEAITGILKSEAPRPKAETRASAEPVTAAPTRQSQRSPPVAAAVASAAVSITASNVESLLDAANKCMRKHDYEQVVPMLEAIPVHKRTEQVRSLLKKARELSDEVAFLLCEIDEALRLNDNEALDKKADALLKLKPKHHKAMQIKEELSRYGSGRVWKAGGWTPDGRRIGEEGWLPWLPLGVGAVVFGISLLCVVLYLRVGDAVVRVQITHPDVEVGIQDRTLNIKSANQDIKVEPGADTLKVSFQGAEFETDKFVLNKGKNPAIVVELFDKTLSAKFGDLSIGEWPVVPNVDDATAASEQPGVPEVPPVTPVDVPVTEPVVTESVVPADADAFNGHSYKFFAERLSWKDAKARCEAMGGHLPIVETAAENAFLDQMAQQGFPASGRGGFESVWLAASDEAKEGDWRWTNGAPLSYKNWLANQPNNKQEREHYALLWLSTDPNRASGQWSDQPNVSEQHVAHFICEWDELRTQSAAQDAAGWTELFNGRDLSGWVRYSTGNPVSSGWTVDEGALHLSPGGGDIRSAGIYADFELEFEWKVARGANSGVIYRARTGDPQPYHSGLEYQILDDANHPNGSNVLTSAGAIYNVAAQVNRPLNPVGQWNRARIIARGNHLEHWLNGSKVAETEIGSAEWNSAVQQSGFARFPQFGKSSSGHIVLQDHGNEVWFRNLRIRDLTAAAASTTEAPADADWTDLFNGRDLSGWTPVAGIGAWSVNNGVLMATAGEGWLATDRDYGDFELELEYRIPTGGNTGVFLRAPATGAPSGVGLLEVQAIDDSAFTNVSDRNHTGAIVGLFAASPRANAPANSWNKVSVRASGSRIIVAVNGVKVCDGDLANQPQAALKPAMQLPLGRIGLQRKGATGVEFRNIRIRELNNPAEAAEPAVSAVPQSPPLPRNEWIDLDPSAATCTSWNWGKPRKNPQNKLWTNGTLVLDNAAVAYNHIQARDVSFKAKVKFLEGQNMALVVRGLHGTGGLYAFFNRVGKDRMHVAFLDTKHSRTLKLADEFDFEVTAIGDRATIKVNGETVVEYPNVKIMRTGHVETTAYNARGTFKSMEVKILDP